MNRIKTHVIITAAIIILMLGVTGCMSNRQNEAEVLREKAESYLKAHYEDSFSPRGYSAKNWAYPYARLVFTSERFAGAEVEVLAYRNEDDSYRFVDNYYQLSMREDAVRYIERIIRGVDPLTVKIRFPRTVWSDSLCGADSFASWAASGNCAMDVFVISQTDIPASEQEAIVGKLTEDGIRGMTIFITTADQNNLKDYTLSEILNNQKQLVVKKSEYDTARN